MYAWKTNGIYRISADTAAQELEQCRDENGVITPREVVERAKAADNPLHGCFEWRDGEAAQKWREQQARVLIGNLTVRIEKDPEEPPIEVRAFIHIVDDDQHGYKAMHTVLESPTERDYMLRKAMAELRSFEVKYGKLAELSGVFAAIQALAEAS